MDYEQPVALLLIKKNNLSGMMSDNLGVRHGLVLMNLECLDGG